MIRAIRDDAFFLILVTKQRFSNIRKDSLDMFVSSEDSHKSRDRCLCSFYNRESLPDLEAQ